MTGAPDLRPAAGWLRRRLLELPARVVESCALETVRTLPPRRLRARVGAPSPAEFRAGGEAVANTILAQFNAGAGGGPAAVLDFGCGCGRVLAPLRERLPGARLHGADVDAEAVAWIVEHLTGVDAVTSSVRPPLPVGEDAYDLIYSISVFSHLTAADQDAWLAEVACRLRPGGTALVSVHGASALEAFRTGAVSTAWCAPDAFTRLGPLADGDFLTVPYRRSRWSRGDLPGVPSGYGLSFHGADYVHEHWGRWLEIEAVLPRAVSGWQDLVVARARAYPPLATGRSGSRLHSENEPG